jgi:hypothetical protein
MEEKTMTLEIKSDRRNLTFGSGETAISHEEAINTLKEFLRAEQIAEMAKDFAFNIYWEEDEIPTINCLETATRPYLIGYRKQAEGERILQQNGNGVCSNCKRQDGIDDLASFCRYCGAKMKGGEST